MCQRCYGVAYRAGEIQPELKVGIHSLTDIDIEAKTAVCAVCGPTRIRVRGGKRGHECWTVRSRNRQGARKLGYTPARHWRSKYGLSADEYARLWTEQDGDCAICGEYRDLVVDHCHATGRVRGLLCHRCNVALGWLDDDPVRMRAVAEYIERHRG